MADAGVSPTTSQSGCNNGFNGKVENSFNATSSDGMVSEQRRSMKMYAWILLVSGVLGATFLFAFDNTIVAVIQPRIIQDLGEIDKLPWITMAFELGATSANLF